MEKFSHIVPASVIKTAFLFQGDSQIEALSHFESYNKLDLPY